MDNATRDFIEKQNDKIYRSIDRLSESMDKKLTGLQTTLVEQNLKLGQGSERFKAINTRFNDNATWHKALLILIVLALSGIAGLALTFLS